MRCPTWRVAGLAIALPLLGLWLALPPAPAETCLSPYVTRINRAEKHLYVFCVDADAKDNDFLVVIDVDRKSKTYGKITYQLDLGSKGNETHHFGFTDDRTHIWGCSLFSNKLFVINVGDDPAKPKLVKTIDSAKESGLTGPHSPYALPGRMLISFLGNKDGDLPAGMAIFLNDGTFRETIAMPKDAPYGYDVAINGDKNRAVTSSFTTPNNYKKPLAKMDLKKFGNKLVVWDVRKKKALQTLTAGAAPLECRWSLAKGANHGYVNCALDNTVWVWEGGKGGKYTARKLFETGKLPADMTQSPDGKYLFVSCFVGDEIQQWDVGDLKKPRMAAKVKGLNQPNMMHLTGDGKRMYVTNSLLSTMDRDEKFWVKLINVEKDTMKIDKTFSVDLTKFKTGPARGHDMLLY
jgi:selenium-binding protein 1